MPEMYGTDMRTERAERTSSPCVDAAKETTKWSRKGNMRSGARRMAFASGVMDDDERD